MRIRISPALALLTLVAGCAPMLGPPPGPGPGAFRPPSPTGPAFRAADFEWSRGQGRNGLTGKIAYRQGPVRYSCAGATVVLTPETPWTRQRMATLYKSSERAALPTEEVRARTPKDPPGGDYSAFVRRATCNSVDHYTFSGLPDGAWYVITIARPAAGAKGGSVALMRRVVTRGGRLTTADL